MINISLPALFSLCLVLFSFAFLLFFRQGELMQPTVLQSVDTNVGLNQFGAMVHSNQVGRSE